MIAVKDNESSLKKTPEEKRKQEEVDCMFTDMTDRYPIGQMIDFIASMDGPTLPEDISTKERRPICATAIQIFDFKRLDSSLQVDYAKTCMSYCEHLIRQYEHEILYKCNSGDKEKDNTWFQAWKSALSRCQHLHKQIENSWKLFIVEKEEKNEISPDIMVQSKIVSDAAQTEFNARKAKLIEEYNSKESTASLPNPDEQAESACSVQGKDGSGVPVMAGESVASAEIRCRGPKIVQSRSELDPESPVPRFQPGKFVARMHALAKQKYPMGKAHRGITFQEIVETHEMYLKWGYLETTRGCRQQPLQDLLDFYEYWTAYTGRRSLPYYNDYYPPSYYHDPSLPSPSTPDNESNANWSPSTPKAPPMYDYASPAASTTSTTWKPHLSPHVQKIITNPYGKGKQSSQSQPVTPSTSSSHSMSNNEGAYAPGFTIPSVTKPETVKLKVSSIPNNSPRSPTSKSQLSISNKFLQKLDASAEKEKNKSVDYTKEMNISSQQMAAQEGDQENINDRTHLKEEGIREVKNSTNELSSLFMASLDDRQTKRKYRLHQNEKNKHSDPPLFEHDSPLLNHDTGRSADQGCEDNQSQGMKKNAENKDGWLVADSGSEGLEALNMVRKLVGKQELPPEEVKVKGHRSKRHVLYDSDDEEIYKSESNYKKEGTAKSDSKDGENLTYKHSTQRKLKRTRRMRARYPNRNPFILSDCSEASLGHESAEPSGEDLSSIEEEVNQFESSKKKPAEKVQRKRQTKVHSKDSEEEVIDIDEMVRKHRFTLNLNKRLSHICDCQRETSEKTIDLLVQTISQLLNQGKGKPTPFIAESINNLHLTLRETGYCMNTELVNAEQCFMEQWKVVEAAICNRQKAGNTSSDDIHKSMKALFDLMKFHFPSISNKINKGSIKR